MKKLLLLFFLMTISLGYSQTFPLDFSDSSDLFTGVDGVTASIVSDGGNDVLQILGPAGEGGTWDNSQLTLSQNLNLSDNANNTITFRFKASAGSSGQHLLKFEGGVGGAAVAEGFFNSTGTDWQNITIDFGAGLGNYSKVVIFTDSGAASNGWNNSGTGTYLIDDLAGGTNVAPPVVLSPAAAASTPSRNAADVISIFSGAYTDVAGTNFFPNWGQATQYSQVSIAGNPTLKYSNLNYQGITFGTPINGSSMESLHFDIWTADCSSFDMFILDGSNPEEKYTVTPTLSGWNSYDINLSSYPNLTKSNLVEFKIVGNGTVYLDNIYFWKSANLPTLSNFSIATKANGSAPFTITPPNSNSSGDFTYTSSNPNVATISGNTITITGVGQTTITANQAAAGSYIAGSISAIFVVTPGPAPAPTASAANVIPIFTDAYPSIEQTTVDSFRTVWSSASLENIVLSGNNTLSYSSLGFVGIETTSSPVDASGMNLFHIDVYTATTTTFKVKLVDFGANGVYGGDDTEHEITLTTEIGWNSFNLLLSSFTGLTTTAHIAQYILSGNGSAYVDNIYFAYQTITVPPALSGFSIPSKATGDADFAITPPTSTSPGTFTYLSSNTAVATIVNGNSIHIVGIGTTTITANQAASGNYTSGSITASFEVTAPIAQAPTTAAPTPPARNAWDVVSLFSGAYANVTLNELPTSWSQLALSPFSVETIDGNATWKFGGEFLGMVTNYDNGIDLTQMTTMHIDYWTPDNKVMIAKIVNTTGPTTEGLTIVQDPVVTGTWRSVDIPMTQFGTSVNKSKITQILLDPQLGGSTVYVDNFYFYRPESSQPSPTITNFTVPSKLVGDSAFTLSAPTSNSSGAFTYTSSNPAVATISGSTVTIVGGGTSIITANQTAAGGFGPGTIAASFVVSFPPPATAAATPTVPADRVLSIFSNAYTNEGGASYPYWGQPAGYIAPAVVQVGTPGNSTLKVDNLTYQGVQLASNIDVSSMTTLHVDIWTPNCTTFEFFLIDSAPTGVPPVEQAVSVSLLPNQWNSIDIPMSSYNTLAKTAVQQFKFVGTPSGSVVYLDNIYFTKPTPTSVAPTTTAVVNYCRGAVATPLTATGYGGALKWYTGTTNATTGVTTYGTASATAPTPVTTTVGSPSKRYQVSQMLSNGIESPRANITVNVLALPTEVLGAITSNTPGTNPGTYVAATLAVGQFVGTTNTVSYRVPEFVGTGLTYYWTVPTGVNIVSQEANVLTVNFLNVASGTGAVGSITVQAQNANGCRTAAKTIALTKVLPTAPAAIKMTIGSSSTAITSFAPYMGTATVLTLTATPSTTATSYVWELPTGVNLLSGATTTSGITSGTSNVITVNFLGVTTATLDDDFFTTTAGVKTYVSRIGVISRNGVGVSTTSNSGLSNPTTTSTARLLTLTAVAPAAPATLVLTNPALPGTAATTAITNISKYIGTSTY
ncbi:MAG: Ig-like domain-containing protein, partial [Flavobacterium sp.]|uniref:Ig-like domain-containing protein n=1 Tax=Flavobacterium sp. TaxID=239 RepID=UPI003BD66EE7